MNGMEPPPGSSSPRTIVSVLYLVILAGLAVGVMAFGPYFVAEHQRLAPWEGVLVWLGDVVALFWFTVYFVRHSLLGLPQKEPAQASCRANLLGVFVLGSILASLGGDLWLTLHLRAAEREAFAGARRTEGTIEALTRTQFKKSVAYTLHCRYVDANGVGHQTVYQLRDPRELPRLAPAVVQAVRAEQLPVPVTIAYDGNRPQRSWLADLGWKDMTRMHGFSLCVFFFQALGSVVFLIMLAGARASRGGLPWWYDLHAVWLVAVEAAFVLLFGGLGLLFRKPFFWGDL